jgi:ribosome-associated toxin RatA of RatAB toxin-antitoxin module
VHTAAILAVAVLAAATSADAPVVKELVERDVKGLSAVFVVDAPPDRIIEVLWDVAAFPKIFPDIKKMDVLARSPSQIDVRFTVDATLAEPTYTLRRTLDAAQRRITWINIAGDVRHIHGSWSVRPLDDGARSEVTYTSFVDVGRIVPTALVRDLAIGKVEAMAKRVRAACAPAR